MERTHLLDIEVSIQCVCVFVCVCVYAGVGVYVGVGG